MSKFEIKTEDNGDGHTTGTLYKDGEKQPLKYSSKALQDLATMQNINVLEEIYELSLLELKLEQSEVSEFKQVFDAYFEAVKV